MRREDILGKGHAVRMLLTLSVVLLSALLLWTAVDKILHWHAFLGVLSDYPLMLPSLVPAAGGIVIAGELCVAMSLWPVTLRRHALIAASGLFFGFALLVGLLYATRGAVPCGCAFSPLTPNAGLEHIAVNILLAVLAFSVWRLESTLRTA